MAEHLKHIRLQQLFVNIGGDIFWLIYLFVFLGRVGLVVVFCQTVINIGAVKAASHIECWDWDKNNKW